ncbi:hypothetical protein PROVRUST_08397 [Providencia rustigianii DSM 4541]|uniref:Uncharacterized protein n=1 Tax=Providencia rustigianii DSM 4541 TaxID=500637 RepID=D1P816_9GAMM|nr:hypothetical protein PROVRUST_08397 [Providencia rustigianii DSM 4541]
MPTLTLRILRFLDAKQVCILRRALRFYRVINLHSFNGMSNDSNLVGKNEI